MSIEVVVFYLLLLDSVTANLFAFFGGKGWYRRHFLLMSRWFPLTKGWTLYYLALVLWVGWLLHQSGLL